MAQVQLAQKYIMSTSKHNLELIRSVGILSSLLRDGGRVLLGIGREITRNDFVQ